MAVPIGKFSNESTERINVSIRAHSFLLRRPRPAIKPGKLIKNITPITNLEKMEKIDAATSVLIKSPAKNNNEYNMIPAIRPKTLNAICNAATIDICLSMISSNFESLKLIKILHKIISALKVLVNVINLMKRGLIFDCI